MALRKTIQALGLTLGITLALYPCMLGTLVLAPSLQAHAIYQHKVVTESKDLNAPEQFGFAHYQVTPFIIPTADGVQLHAWHVVPLLAYQANQQDLLAQGPQAGLAENFEQTINFRLLRDNPVSRLVLYFHGASGNMASWWRPDSYRSLYSADPVNTHVLTFDYRGYGKSSGSPSEAGLIEDAIAVADWAINTAGIPPERIVIFGQSLGSAVAIALVNELAKKESSVSFAGLIVTGTFAGVAEIAATYRLGGIVPILSPLFKMKPVFDFFIRHATSTWDNTRRLGEFVEVAEKIDITFLHAEDDFDVPIEHSKKLFREAIRIAEGVEESADTRSNLLDRINERTEMRGEGGSSTVWHTKKGDIRLEALKYGVHDRLMSYPVTGLAVNRAFTRNI